MINPFGNATLIVAFFLCVQSFAVAQTRRSTVSGFVLDAESEESLPGAVIMTDEGNTVANNYGFFSIPLTRGQHTLRTMYLGHSESEMELHFSSDTTIIIRMRPDAVLKESLVTSSNVLRESYTRITASNVLDSPVVLGEPDVLKYVQLLPGVSGGLEGTSSVLVRGGGPDENLFLLDGVPMYNVSHMLGLFSAFSPDAIKNVSFYKDGFPSRFGGRVSSVLDIRKNDGDRHDCHASITAGLLASRFHFEGPIIKDKTSFSLSARAFNTLFAAPFINRDDCTLYYLFYDLNGKIYHAFSKYDTLTLTAYHGGDTFSYLSDENMVSGPGFRYLAQDGMGMDWGSTLASLKWNHLSRKNFFYSTSISWYGYNMLSEVKSWKTQFNETELDRSLFESWIQDIILKSDLDYSLSPSHKLTAGFSATRHLFTPSVSRRKFLDNTDSAPRNPATEYSGWELAAYIEDEFRPFDSFEMDLGLRYTIMTVGQKTYNEPQEVHKVTLILWIEGEDPDCTDQILGGQINFNLEFTLV
nr:TonB-dependent receptor [Prevotella sp.]